MLGLQHERPSDHAQDGLIYAAAAAHDGPGGVARRRAGRGADRRRGEGGAQGGLDPDKKKDPVVGDDGGVFRALGGKGYLAPGYLRAAYGLVRFPLLYQLLKWWVQQDSNLRPAD
jgi:hypothetical protein